MQAVWIVGLRDLSLQQVHRNSFCYFEIWPQSELDYKIPEISSSFRFPCISSKRSSFSQEW